MIGSLLLAAGVVVQVLPRDATDLDATRRRPVRVVCAVGKTTRIVLPEPLLGFKASAETKAALGLRPVAHAPQAVFEATPTAHPVKGAFEFKGRSIAVTVVLESAEKGEAQEVRLELEKKESLAASTVASASVARSAAARPGSTALSTPVSAARSAGPTKQGGGEAVSAHPPSAAPPSETRRGEERASGAPGPEQLQRDRSVPAAAQPSSSTSAPAAPVPNNKEQSTASPSVAEGGSGFPTPRPGQGTQTLAQLAEAPSGVDLQELLLLTPERIGREEALPGQRPVILEDALKSNTNVFLRFRAVGAAKEKNQVASVSWEHGVIRSYTVVPSGRDLRILVQLPRARVSKATRISMKLTSGDSYKFALSAPWFSSFLRSVF
jgi:hypothetical protein